MQKMKGSKKNEKDEHVGEYRIEELLDDRIS